MLKQRIIELPVAAEPGGPLHGQLLFRHRPQETREKGVRRITYNMTAFMEQCVERYLELANVSASTLKHVTTSGMDEHSFTTED